MTSPCKFCPIDFRHGTLWHRDEQSDASKVSLFAVPKEADRCNLQMRGISLLKQGSFVCVSWRDWLVFWSLRKGGHSSHLKFVCSPFHSFMGSFVHSCNPDGLVCSQWSWGNKNGFSLHESRQHNKKPLERCPIDQKVGISAGKPCDSFIHCSLWELLVLNNCENKVLLSGI